MMVENDTEKHSLHNTSKPVAVNKSHLNAFSRQLWTADNIRCHCLRQFPKLTKYTQLVLPDYKPDNITTCLHVCE